MALTDTQKRELASFIEGKIADKVQDYEPESEYMPFLSRIVRDEKSVRMYSFIQSLVTSFGMSFYEQMTQIIAKYNSEEVIMQWRASNQVSIARLAKIEDIIRMLGNGERKPDRVFEVREILAIKNDDMTLVEDGRVVDVYIRRGKNEYYIDIKTVKPNKGGFKDYKRTVLTWVARADRPIGSFIAFPYNPYHPNPYNRIGFKKFMSSDDVKIGKEYWDFIGGEGCYESLLDIFDKVGIKYWDVLKAKLESAGTPVDRQTKIV